MTSDTFYLQNRIQLEANNLERNHVYYSVDEQPEVCARLIAQGIKAGHRVWKAKKAVEQLGINRDTAYGFGQRVAEGIANGIDKLAYEALFGQRVSVTVQGWEDVPAAIGLIRERQREFKKGMR